MKRRVNADGSTALIADESMQSKYRIETWLMERMSEQLRIPFRKFEAEIGAGITTFEIRRDRMRELIRVHDLTHLPLGKRKGRTYQTFFEHLYGQPIFPPPGDSQL